MHQILSYSPGQIATVTLDTYISGVSDDGYSVGGRLADGYALPTVQKIYFPNGTLAGGFPLPMVKLGTGLYQYKFTLPTGAAAVGSYVVVLQYFDAFTTAPLHQVVEINVSVPFGNFSISPG